MRTFLLLVALPLLVALTSCDSTDLGSTAATDDTDLLGKQDKAFICHVGNETYFDGENTIDYLDCASECPVGDLTCLAACPDAGKIDLINVSVKALEGQHSLTCDPEAEEQPNQCHCYGGVCDFLPIDATLETAKEDTDGDGIDDGCDTCPEEYGDSPDGCPGEASCPCFTAADLAPVSWEEWISEAGIEESLRSTEEFAGVCLADEEVCGGVYMCAFNVSEQDFFVEDISEDQALACQALVVAEAGEEGLSPNTGISAGKTANARTYSWGN